MFRDNMKTQWKFSVIVIMCLISDIFALNCSHILVSKAQFCIDRAKLPAIIWHPKFVHGQHEIACMYAMIRPPKFLHGQHENIAELFNN